MTGPASADQGAVRSTSRYYQWVNTRLLDLVPLTARRVLEVGCGEGGLGAAYLNRNPAATYAGIELFEPAARGAARRLTQVIWGDVEGAATLEALDRWRDGRLFDVLVFGDVLEHLRDPWSVLRTMCDRLAEGGTCVVCVPNVAHWSVVVKQIRGRWDYADVGLLDRTHIRFFTRATAIEMIRSAGLQLVDTAARMVMPAQAEAAVTALLPFATWLGAEPDALAEDLSAYQIYLRSVKGPTPARLTVVGVGQDKATVATQARLDQPMRAMASLPEARVIWDSPGVRVPQDAEPGIFVLQRQTLTDPRFRAHLDRRVAAGWVLVLDWDDDPRMWRAIVESAFLCFRYVHAVSVGTEALAALVRHWNPTVAVLPDAAATLRPPAAGPRQPPQLRILVDAAGADWAAIEPGIVQAGRILGERVRFVFPADSPVFDGFPLPAKERHEPLPEDGPADLLATCDVVLIGGAAPFASDRRLVEACAAGAVPICSPAGEAAGPQHRDVALFATTPGEWSQQLLAICSNAGMLRRKRAAGQAYVGLERLQSHQLEARLRWYRALLAERGALERLRQGRLADIGPG